MSTRLSPSAQALLVPAGGVCVRGLRVTSRQGWWLSSATARRAAKASAWCPFSTAQHSQHSSQVKNTGQSVKYSSVPALPGSEDFRAVAARRTAAQGSLERRLPGSALASHPLHTSTNQSISQSGNQSASQQIQSQHRVTQHHCSRSPKRCPPRTCSPRSRRARWP